LCAACFVFDLKAATGGPVASEVNATLTAAGKFVTLAVRAKPRGRRNRIEGERNGALAVSVTAAPENGAANEAIVEVVAAALHLRRGDVALVRGQTSRDKLLRISGLTVDEARTRLANALSVV
jgi:uncharacterized protein YggU (UPF0235/DUF167 family)